MSIDEAAAIGGYVRHPKYRADSIEWFHDPTADRKIDFTGPQDVYAAIEEAAERADRTFNDQLLYALRVCRGDVAIDFDDERSVLEWRDLMGQMKMQLNSVDEWIPCSVIFPNSKGVTR